MLDSQAHAPQGEVDAGNANNETQADQPPESSSRSLPSRILPAIQEFYDSTPTPATASTINKHHEESVTAAADGRHIPSPASIAEGVRSDEKRSMSNNNPTQSSDPQSNRRRLPVASPPIYSSSGAPDVFPSQASSSSFPPSASPGSGPPQQYASQPPYNSAQRTGYVGMGQPYTMSTPTLPHQYAYSHTFHPSGMPTHDPNVMSGMVPYGTNSLSPPPHHTHGHGAMMYPFQRPTQEPTTSAASQTAYALSGSGGPSPSGTPHPSQLPFSNQQMATSFPSLQYSAVTASPQFTYSGQTHAYSPAQQGMYQSQYHSYNQQESPAQGTWWYFNTGNSPTHTSGGPVGFEQQSPFQGQWYQAVMPGPSQQQPPTASSSSFTPPTGPSVSNNSSSSGPTQSGRGPIPTSTLNLGSNRSPRKSPVGRTSPSVGSDQAPRRSYHPNPPAHRSDWVMWVGNVPSDATHDELWRFFNQSTKMPPRPPHLPTDLLTLDDDVWGGVSSIFLISRSNCAFVNFDTEGHLEAAVAYFNGKPIRPNDPRCPRLVCRVRRKDDDLRAGVGGQRGMGMHTRHVKELMERDRAARGTAEDQSSEPPASPSSADHPQSSASEGQHTTGDEDTGRSGKDKTPPRYSGSSGSYASTSSSFLTKHFPQRYFILKSLSQFDLDLSVERGVWATQPHNEGVLDQAYRTSNDVFLIFGVNKSGEFFGYARMEGPISAGEKRVSWASRTDSSPAHSYMGSPTRSRASHPPQPIAEEEEAGNGAQLPHTEHKNTSTVFSPSRLADNSPIPVTPEDRRLERASAVKSMSSATGQFISAPAELHQKHRQLTYNTPQATSTLNMADLGNVPPLAGALKSATLGLSQDFQLDEDAPARAAREQRNRGSSSREQTRDSHGILHKDTMVLRDPSPPSSPEKGTGAAKGEEHWGTAFPVRWIRTDRLPFYRTRHLRNPWNHDREVKVSRDGTELEPSVGQKLLDEWERPDPPPPPPQQPSFPRRPGTRPPFRLGESMPATTRPLVHTDQGSTVPRGGAP